MFTCSQKAPVPVRAFTKALASVFPGCLYLARAGKSIDSLVSFARYQGLEHLLVFSPLGKDLRQLDCRGLAISEDGWKESFSASVAAPAKLARKKFSIDDLRLAVTDKKLSRFLALLVDTEAVSEDATFALEARKKTFHLLEAGKETGFTFSVEALSFAK